MKELLNKKKYIIIAFVIVIIGVGLVVANLGKKEKTNDPKVNAVENTNAGIIKEAVVEGIKIHDIKMETIDGMTTYTAKATNTTDSDIEFEGFALIVKGEGFETELGVYGIGFLGAGNTTELTNYSDVDLSKATSIEYKFVKQLKVEENHDVVEPEVIEENNNNPEETE